MKGSMLGLVGVVLAMLIISGCATTEMALLKKVVPDLKSGGAVVVVTQNNLGIAVPASNPGNTGLLGALVVAGVDAARQADAEKQAKPIIAALQTYDFRAVLKKTLTTELQNVTTFKFGTDLQQDTIASAVQRRIDFDNAEGDAVLFIYVEYRLESGNLIVEANAILYPKTDELKAYRVNPKASDPVGESSFIYKRTFSVSQQGITDKNVAEKLDGAAQSIAKQLVADLNHPQ